MREKVRKVYGVGYPFCVCVRRCSSVLRARPGFGCIVGVYQYVSVLSCFEDEGQGHENARVTGLLGKINEGELLLLTGTLWAALNVFCRNEALRRVLACGVCRRTFSLEDWGTCQKIGD